MKNSLPTTAKVSKEAKECVQECVSEFISFIVSVGSSLLMRARSRRMKKVTNYDSRRLKPPRSA
jgi:histone H3/H4